jgi:hypothetical protein
MCRPHPKVFRGRRRAFALAPAEGATQPNINMIREKAHALFAEARRLGVVITATPDDDEGTHQLDVRARRAEAQT